MSSQSLNVVINVDGKGAISVIKELNANFGSLTQMTDNLKNISFQAIVSNVRNVTDAIRSAVRPGADFESSMADLSAMTGVVGEELKTIGERARENAKVFGGDAARSVETYKLLLGQLSPELAKTPEALDAMGRNVSILSKQMGNDVVAATEVLTTAMNQYQVSLDNPIAASKEMSEMMNTMTAAALEGSAELPQIKTALEQVGMVAKTAAVSFSETNAAIQVLDKAGRRGSEGGVALRNIIGDLDRGRFLPKVVKEEFKRVGVDVDVLSDHTLSLSDRLQELKPIMNDAALMSKLFGEANYASGVALLSNIDEIERLNTAIQGTNAAEEFAATTMDTYNEAVSRIQARFADLKISIFNATSGFLPFIEVIGSSAVQLSMLLPLLTLIGKALKVAVWPAVINSTKAVITFTRTVIWNRVILSSWYAIQGICITVTNLLTGSINLATAATRIFNAVFKSSPLGWIALGIGAIAGAFALLRNNAADAAVETGKTLQNLKEQAQIDITGELARKKGERDVKLAEIQAKLDAAETPENKKGILKTYAGQYEMSFDEKAFEQDADKYQKDFLEKFQKVHELNGEKEVRSNAYAGAIEDIAREEEYLAGEREKIKKERRGLFGSYYYETPEDEAAGRKTTVTTTKDSDGNEVYYTANIKQREENLKELRKLAEKLLKELRDAEADKAAVLNGTYKPIIPSISTKTEKDSSSIRGGEGIKNINITINDGLVNDVKNYFQGGEYNFEDFQQELRRALTVVLNDANTI